MKMGGKDELSYAKEHPLDTGVRASLAAGVGYLAGDAYNHGSTALKWSVFGGSVISTAHFLGPDHIEDVTSKGADRHMPAGAAQLGYVAGRFTTDASMMIGTAAIANRITWNVKGNNELESIITNERELRRFNGHVGSRGRWYGGHSEETPIFRQERGESAAFLLNERGQFGRMPGVIDRLAVMSEPENVVNWSTGVRIPKFWPHDGGPPAFDPKALLAKDKLAH